MSPRIVPDLSFEQTLWAADILYVAGVDEVGRGPLCGPVVAAACVMDPTAPMLAEVRDSKALAPATRARLAGAIRQHALAVGLGAASAAEIDRLHIYQSTRLAMIRAVAQVQRQVPLTYVLLDGRPIKGIEYAIGPYQAVVKGDARCYSIACASIIAKVTRDALLNRLAARYPGYGWEHNAGYGTPEHLAALMNLGASPHHRRSFAPLKTWTTTSLTSAILAGALLPENAISTPTIDRKE